MWETGNGENSLVLALHAGLGTGLWAFRKEQPTGVRGKRYLITDTVRVTGREGWAYGKFCRAITSVAQPALNTLEAGPGGGLTATQQLLPGTVQGH